jgi:hypothetical protein
MTHRELVLIGLRWLRRQCTIVFSEFATAAYEIPDVIGWKEGFSTLIECKVSRADFLSDKRKIARSCDLVAMGYRRYYLCEPEIIKVEDIPLGWGLLWTERKRVFVKQEPEPFDTVHYLSEVRFLVSMLRRVQVRLGQKELSDWLRWENIGEAKREIR